MILNGHMCYVLAALCLMVHSKEAVSEISTASDNALNTIYDNILQREYAGPVVFPNHQVERKAQRSPSLRLRFGRRSDPDVMPNAEKRWFGDVRQKPIRSPSLRLRFGRRSDPTVPLRSSLDVLLNDLTNGDADNAVDDYNNVYDGYERAIRKPARLRWGRSVPMTEGALNAFADDDFDRAEQSDDLLNSLLASQKLRNILLSLRQYDADNVASMEDADNEFEREARKPAPLRLRFGRSTGGQIAAMMKAPDAEKQLNLVDTTNAKKAQGEHGPNEA